MAILDAENRRRTWAHAMRFYPVERLGPLPPVTKPQLRAVVDYTDDWIESSQGNQPPAAGYNSGLPEPWKSSATPAAKTWMFCLVAMRRAGMLRAMED